MSEDKTLVETLVEQLRERSAKLRGYITSSQRVVDLLQPEMDRFEARTGHDIYTLRLAVDHQSGIRTQTKEAAELEQAADHIEAQAADIARLVKAVTLQMDEKHKEAKEAKLWFKKTQEGWAENKKQAVEIERLREVLGYMVNAFETDSGEVDRRLAMKDARIALGNALGNTQE